MSRNTHSVYAATLGVLGFVIGTTSAFSHVEVGKRLFPATLLIEDPGVMDELALPTFVYLTNSDGSRQYDISGEWSKTITPDLGFGIGNTLTNMRNPRVGGWQNIETGLKYVLFRDPEHEFMLASGVASVWGHTGNGSVGADRYTAWGPEIFFGKGFGDLPTSLDLLRPLAVTGQFGISFSTHPLDAFLTPGEEIVDPVTGFATTGPSGLAFEKRPTFFDWGFTVQYSLPYLDAYVAKVGGPEFLKNIFFVVEGAFATPVANIPDGGHTTTGLIAPGLIYSSDTFQIAAELLIPVNSASGRNVGAIAQLHFYLDELFPDSLGKPLFGHAEHASYEH